VNPYDLLVNNAKPSETLHNNSTFGFTVSTLALAVPSETLGA
jgi:hypothetical protein